MKMKFSIIMILLVSVFFNGNTQSVASGSPHEKGLHFEGNLNWAQIMAKAKAENKYIFVDLFTTWCAPCKRMEKSVYINDTVGRYMDEKFVSVKIQMDTSFYDNLQVKSWYADAHAIGEKYRIVGYPSFLFFSPDGKLVYRDIGFKNVSDLISLGKKALNPQNIIYYALLDDYKKGIRNHDTLYTLARYAKTLSEDKLARQIAEDYINSRDRKVLISSDKIYFVLDVSGNRKLADSLAREYYKKYLDHLSEDELCAKENLYFMTKFGSIVNSNDEFFHLCYSKPEKIDSAMQSKGWAKWLVENTIIKEYIQDKLLKDGKPIFKSPNWDNIAFTIHKKYEDVDANFLVIEYQLAYYKLTSDWPEYTKTLIKRVEKYGVFGPVPVIDFNFNNLAWDLFQHSSDRSELLNALSWSDSAINIVSKSKNQFNLANWMDTKANILYKLGRIEEALELENKVLTLSPNAKDFQANLGKMRNGKPTWPQ